MGNTPKKEKESLIVLKSGTKTFKLGRGVRKDMNQLVI